MYDSGVQFVPHSTCPGGLILNELARLTLVPLWTVESQVLVEILSQDPQTRKALVPSSAPMGDLCAYVFKKEHQTGDISSEMLNPRHSCKDEKMPADTLDKRGGEEE